jgi:hypothetical protein
VRSALVKSWSACISADVPLGTVASGGEANRRDSTRHTGCNTPHSGQPHIQVWVEVRVRSSQASLSSNCGGRTSRQETDERCRSRCDQHDKNEWGSPPERDPGNDDTDETSIDRD